MTDEAPATPDSAESGAWLPLRPALAHLGIAERTLYRRIDRGELRTQKDGPRLLVWCAGAEPIEADATPDRQIVAHAPADVALALYQRVEELAAARQVPLLARIDEKDATIREQAEEIGRLRERLEAAERVADVAPVSLPEPERRSWWKRWFGA